jgi:hypothetical protein
LLILAITHQLKQTKYFKKKKKEQKKNEMIDNAQKVFVQKGTNGSRIYCLKKNIYEQTHTDDSSLHVYKLR